MTSPPSGPVRAEDHVPREEMSDFGAVLWNLSASFFCSGLFWALVALSWVIRVGGKDALVLPVLLWDRRPHMCSGQGQHRVSLCEVTSRPLPTHSAQSRDRSQGPSWCLLKDSPGLCHFISLKARFP